jgi:hypothetical protein
MQRSDRHWYLWSPIGRIIPLVVLGLIWQAVSTFRLVDPSFRRRRYVWLTPSAIS